MDGEIAENAEIVVETASAPTKTIGGRGGSERAPTDGEIAEDPENDGSFVISIS